MKHILAACLFVLAAPLAQACGSAEEPCRIASGSYHFALPETDAIKGVVMHLHGGGGRGATLLRSGIAREALTRGYLFVAPNGEHPGARFPHNWAVRARNFGHEKDDIAFLEDVFADLQERFEISRDNLLLAGFSRGGSMAWDVACFNPGFARAYAPTAGAFWEDLPETCEGAVDLFHTHGWADRTVPLEGRPLWDGSIVQGDVFASLAILREANGCTARQPDEVSTEGERWFRRWTDCERGRIDLMLHPGGHGSPRGWAKTVMDWFEDRLTEAGG